MGVYDVSFDGLGRVRAWKAADEARRCRDDVRRRLDEELGRVREEAAESPVVAKWDHVFRSIGDPRPSLSSGPSVSPRLLVNPSSVPLPSAEGTTCG